VITNLKNNETQSTLDAEHHMVSATLLDDGKGVDLEIASSPEVAGK
jgi:hypothetical protein